MNPIYRFFPIRTAGAYLCKPAFLAGLVSCAFAGGAYLLPLGISGAYLGRVLQGFGEACLYTGAAAWVVEIAGVVGHDAVHAPHHRKPPPGRDAGRDRHDR